MTINSNNNFKSACKQGKGVRYGHTWSHDQIASRFGKTSHENCEKSTYAILGQTVSPRFYPGQLFAILILRQFFQTDYRGIVQLLEDLTGLKKVLGLTKVPHFTTLQKAQQRLVKKGLGTICSPQFSLMPELTN